MGIRSPYACERGEWKGAGDSRWRVREGRLGDALVVLTQAEMLCK